jgi:glycosyltransferase involved in cell wall biosynthesis
MKFTLLHPSRSRPKLAVQTAQEWIKKAGSDNVEWILSLDLDDPHLIDYQVALKEHSIYKLCVNQNTSVVDATNKAAKYATGDVLIYLSDDFSCPDNWAQLIEKEVEKYSGCWLLKVDDCLQGFSIAVCTIPIMSRKMYDVLGYFWHPEYKSMFVDEHLYWKAKLNNWLKLAPHLKFPHNHPSNGRAQNDETYTRSAKNWDQGKALFQKHKNEGFIS